MGFGGEGIQNDDGVSEACSFVDLSNKWKATTSSTPRSTATKRAEKEWREAQQSDGCLFTASLLDSVADGIG